MREGVGAVIHLLDLTVMYFMIAILVTGLGAIGLSSRCKHLRFKKAQDRIQRLEILEIFQMLLIQNFTS